MYEKIIKALRICTSKRTLSKCSKLCPYLNIPNCKTHLMRHAAEAIEELSKRNNILTDCVNEVEDALDRADNEWARAALNKAEEKLREIPVTEQLPEDIPLIDLALHRVNFHRANFETDMNFVEDDPAEEDGDEEC